MEQEYAKRITVTDGPSKGICTIPRSYINPNVFTFPFTFAANRQESRITIKFKVTSPEICGGFKIEGVTEDGVRIKGIYYPPDFDSIFLDKKVAARKGSFTTNSRFNPF